MIFFLFFQYIWNKKKTKPTFVFISFKRSFGTFRKTLNWKKQTKKTPHPDKPIIGSLYISPFNTFFYKFWFLNFIQMFWWTLFSELGRVTLVLTEEQKLVLSTQRRNSTSDQNSSEISLMKSNSVTSGNSVSDEIVISRSEWDSLQCELDKLRALMGLGKFFIMST